MPALPADIAKYTTNGVVVTAKDDTILDRFPDAIDASTEEIEMFYDSADDARTVTNALFAIRSKIAPAHIAVEVLEGLSLGNSIPIAPTAPSFTVLDEDKRINENMRVISYGYQMGSGRHSIELHA
jgi:hypothetical protein